MDSFVDCEWFEVRREGVVQGVVVQRGGGQGSLHQGRDGGGRRPLAWLSPPLHLDPSDLCQHQVWRKSDGVSAL